MKYTKYVFIMVFVTCASVVYSGQSNPNAAPGTAIASPAEKDVSNGGFQMDIYDTNEGELKITFYGHASLMFNFAGKSIYIDPVTQYADYTKQPKADLILVTHDHGDHLDVRAIDALKKEGTQIVLTKACSQKVTGGIVMNNGDTKTIDGLKIEAVPAYNLDPQTRFHPKGVGNGYVITFGDKKVYIAGDTENIPEMKNLKDIYIAFLPMNLPYTMTPEMAAEAAKVIKPKILYPYHYGQTDTKKIVDLLKDSGIEVLIRKLS